MSGKTRTRLFELMAEMGHEQVVFRHDDASGYRGIIAIHSTTLGPAVGGTRFWNYANEEEAMIDALRLSRGMTYTGGVLSGGADLFGWSPEKVRTEVLAIYATLLSIFEIAKAEGIPTYKAADRLAECRLREGVEQYSAR
jgi:glutamate dehydrogenase/leucine dehydrogenase